MADNLTEDEEKDMEKQDISEGEAHREGEFDDLRNKIDNLTDIVSKLSDLVSDKIDGLNNLIDEKIGTLVENGASVNESGESSDIDLNIDGDDLTKALEDLDFSI